MSKEKLEKFIENEKCYKYSQDSRWHLKKGHDFWKLRGRKNWKKMFSFYSNHIRTLDAITFKKKDTLGIFKNWGGELEKNVLVF